MNWDMLGHEWAVSLLKEHIAQEQVRHAYLLCGPQGVGRRTLALRFAQALNCPKSPTLGTPCRKCRRCMQIERMQYSDLTVVQAEQPGGTLKVDQIRELGRSLALSAYESRYRVALLLRFEEANANAMNALLKTLEEPAPRVVLVLTAESAESLLPTIVSRCEVLRLRPIPLEQVRQGLQTNWGLPDEQARFVAHISGGRPGYSLRLYQEPERLEQRQAWLDDLDRLIAASRVERFAYAEGISKDRNALREMLQVWISFWRDVLLRTAGASTPVANLDRTDQIENLATRLDLQAVHGYVAGLERILGLLERNINARLAVEVLMLDLPRY